MKLTAKGRYAVTAMLDKDRRCLTHDLWADLSDHISDFLSKTSLAELVERHRLCQPRQTQETVVKFRALRRKRCLNSDS
jgi:DNA-binding IscR family transcriptional regulator